MRRWVVLLLVFAISFSFKIPYVVENAFGDEMCSARVLFDNAHLETAGNADWTINGAYSDFADGLRAYGFCVEEWGHDDPDGAERDKDSPITYNVLKDYDVYIIPEPNQPFTSQETLAIKRFIAEGGGVFFIADHAGADRNGNGWDAVRIFNVWVEDFGFKFDNSNYWQYPLTQINQYHPIGRGVNAIGAWGASSISITSPQAGIEIVASFSNGKPYVVAGSYGLGRFVAIGDSSPFDDGTGNPRDKLYDGWHDVDDAVFAVNVAKWLARSSGPWIQFISPYENANVWGRVEVKFSFGGDVTPVVAYLYIDGDFVFSATVSPAVYEWDTSSVNVGKHILKVVVEDAAGFRASAELSVNVLLSGNEKLLIIGDSDEARELASELAGVYWNPSGDCVLDGLGPGWSGVVVVDEVKWCDSDFAQWNLLFGDVPLIALRSSGKVFLDFVREKWKLSLGTFAFLDTEMPVSSNDGKMIASVGAGYVYEVIGGEGLVSLDRKTIMAISKRAVLIGADWKVLEPLSVWVGYSLWKAAWDHVFVWASGNKVRGVIWSFPVADKVEIVNTEGEVRRFGSLYEFSVGEMTDSWDGDLTLRVIYEDGKSTTLVIGGSVVCRDMNGEIPTVLGHYLIPLPVEHAYFGRGKLVPARDVSGYLGLGFIILGNYKHVPVKGRWCSAGSVVVLPGLNTISFPENAEWHVIGTICRALGEDMIEGLKTELLWCDGEGVVFFGGPSKS